MQAYQRVEAPLPFQHTAARRRLGTLLGKDYTAFVFQHTAARRRLEYQALGELNAGMFQHTAARRRLAFLLPSHKRVSCFNTQPPEGGW